MIDDDEDEDDEDEDDEDEDEEDEDDEDEDDEDEDDGDDEMTPHWKHTLHGSKDVGTTRTGKKNCGTRSLNTAKITGTRGKLVLDAAYQQSDIEFTPAELQTNWPQRTRPSCSTGPAVMVAGTNRDAKRVKPAMSPASLKSIQCRRRRNSLTGRGSAGVEDYEDEDDEGWDDEDEDDEDEDDEDDDDEEDDEEDEDEEDENGA